MSGSDAPPGGGGWGGYIEDPVDCAGLRLNRYLQGPVPQIVDALAKGDVLHVRLRRGQMADDNDDQVDRPGGADTVDDAGSRPLDLQPVDASPVESVVEAPAPELPDVLPEEIIATDEHERLAGGVLPTTALLDCLRRGVEFVGVVQGTNGGAVQIEVQKVTCGTLRRLVTIEPSGDRRFVVGDLFGVMPPADRNSRVTLVDETQSVVGTVDADVLVADCIQGGSEYRAVVVEVSDSSVMAVLRACQ